MVCSFTLSLLNTRVLLHYSHCTSITRKLPLSLFHNFTVLCGSVCEEVHVWTDHTGSPLPVSHLSPVATHPPSPGFNLFVVPPPRPLPLLPVTHQPVWCVIGRVDLYFQASEEVQHCLYCDGLVLW